MSILRYWYIPLLAIGAVLLWMAWPKGRKPLDRIAEQIEVIEAKADVKKLQALRGKEMAKAQVEAQYRRELEELDAKTEAKRDRLRDDPSALAALAVRVARKRRRDRGRRAESG